MKLATVKGHSSGGTGASDFENVREGDDSERINGRSSEQPSEESSPGPERHLFVDADDINANHAGEPVTKTNKNHFDFFVIGGGSGGLASAIHSAKYGIRVGLCDLVTPTPSGNTWGVGGTCVNVGCIPKKLMHQAALLGEGFEDAPHFGWTASEYDHDWKKMVDNIRAHIQSLNWGYRVALQKAGVEYYNAQAQFVDSHTILLRNKSGDEVARVTSKYFLIATGGRPKYLEDIPGATKDGHCITSDDIFFLPHSPGKVVIVGASYIALETAGFLSGLGLDVTILVRSQLLRGFDQQMAEKIGKVLESHGVQILRDSVPTNIELLSVSLDSDADKPIKKVLMVHGKNLKTGDIIEEPCNTVILAVGRQPSVASLHLKNCGVEVDSSDHKIVVNAEDQTSTPHIFAVGDVAHGRPELTPVAIHAGVLLAKRLFGKSSVLCDYDKVPTTIFTPLEYGAVGLSEESAVQLYGETDVEIYHVVSQPLEYTLPSKHKFSCYSKLICVKSLGLRVVGFHYLGPHAGEITQGFAVAIKMNATKDDLDGTIGIHPTCAEQFTTMTVTKFSGENCIKTGC